MPEKTIHECQCPNCQQLGEHPDKELHRQMNLFLSRLDEQQPLVFRPKDEGRRWYVALEAKKMGRGGARRMSQITGLHVETIRRGQRELENMLTSRPVDRVRQPGGGRKRVKKKSQASKKR